MCVVLVRCWCWCWCVPGVLPKCLSYTCTYTGVRMQQPLFWELVWLYMAPSKLWNIYTLCMWALGVSSGGHKQQHAYLPLLDPRVTRDSCCVCSSFKLVWFCYLACRCPSGSGQYLAGCAVWDIPCSSSLLCSSCNYCVPGSSKAAQQ
jgi:hypothetical protein